MARPYSDELREKSPSTFKAGNIGLEELAAMFPVSLGWAEKEMADGGMQRRSIPVAVCI